MAQELIKSPKVRWGIPLVLPHVLVSVGLLVFVAVDEQPARPAIEQPAPELVSAPGAITANAVRSG
ncbi:hypothetical protein [Methylobacterium gnaphalii]|uniref:Uncharacterized protein n=1 Tax=Methylobacterium gnaphalii TaxID=1010610 RepID=A0A512JNN9_9HYPH|nr:hypothetical protein [Methylobacterium gnaphalii]GEP11574.1 hypothetical protein MGN01_34190 [Methylobacterium gnaphalii]GJD70315.1 hypothetical protein MMMDOFMJ_3260 [Methylobacterium gnaphalii]GLS47209.1 hypothetical protein GCM10007885_00530 [Methylobacterium gnaphalii]